MIFHGFEKVATEDPKALRN